MRHYEFSKHVVDLDKVCGVEVSNVTKADGEIMFSFEPKDLTDVCSVFKIKKKVRSKMTEEQKQIARDRLKEAREHKNLTT